MKYCLFFCYLWKNKCIIKWLILIKHIMHASAPLNQITIFSVHVNRIGGISKQNDFNQIIDFFHLYTGYWYSRLTHAIFPEQLPTAVTEHWTATMSRCRLRCSLLTEFKQTGRFFFFFYEESNDTVAVWHYWWTIYKESWHNHTSASSLSLCVFTLALQMLTKVTLTIQEQSGEKAQDLCKIISSSCKVCYQGWPYPLCQ